MTPAVASSAYLATIVRRFARRMWWWGLVPLPVIAWGLACDVRIAIVGFMLLLIILPMLAVPTVLRYCADRRMAARSAASRFEFDGAKIRCFKQIENPDPDLPPLEELIDTVTALSARRSGKNIVFTIGRGIADFVIVPAGMAPQATMSKFESNLEGELD